MAQKVVGFIKLQIPAGKATPAPPGWSGSWSAWRQHYVLYEGIQRAYQKRYWHGNPCGYHRLCGPLFLVRNQDSARCNPDQKACGIESGSGVPNKTKVAKITKEQVRKIAEQKMPDLNAANVESAMSMIAGTARSMGVEVVD